MVIYCKPFNALPNFFIDSVFWFSERKCSSFLCLMVLQNISWIILSTPPFAIHFVVNIIIPKGYLIISRTAWRLWFCCDIPCLVIVHTDLICLPLLPGGTYFRSLNLHSYLYLLRLDCPTNIISFIAGLPTFTSVYCTYLIISSIGMSIICLYPQPSVKIC